MQKGVAEMFESMIGEFIPGHSIDCVVLGFEDQCIKLLLLKLLLDSPQLCIVVPGKFQSIPQTG